MANPALTYESNAVPTIFGPWATALVEAVSPREGERVLDVACGTGIVARQAAMRVRSVGTVVGLDASPAMLEVARQAAEREGVELELHEGRMESLPFPDGAFDVVFCQQGLQFAGDRAAAAVEMHRVLARGGRVGIAVWRGLEEHPFHARFNEVLLRHLGIPALAAPFSLPEAGELTRLLEEAGFLDVVVEARSMSLVEPDPAGFVERSVETIAAAIPDVQHLAEADRQALKHAIGAELEPDIGARTRDGRMVLDWHAHLARARSSSVDSEQNGTAATKL